MVLIAYVLVLLEKHFWLLFRISCWNLIIFQCAFNCLGHKADIISILYKIVVGAANRVYLLETDFSTIEVLSGSQIKVISMFTYDPDGDGYYVLSKNGELKKLDNQLNVQRIRRVCHVNKFAWVKDRLTQEKQVFFLPSREYEYGIRYSYDRDLFMNLGWRYEFIDMTLNRSRESNKLYLLES